MEVRVTHEPPHGCRGEESDGFSRSVPFVHLSFPPPSLGRSSSRFYSGHPTTARRGTDAYMAPEQLRMGYDQQVDIWAAGVMLYILATFPHEFPFGFISEPGNPQELMSIYSRIQRREVDLAKIGDEHVRDLVDHLMHMDPAQRPSAQLALTHSMFAQQYPGLEQAPPPGLEELAPPPGLEQPAPAPAPPPGLE